MELNKNTNVKEVKKFIKEEIEKHVVMHRSEHDPFYQALEEVLLSVAPLYLLDEKYARNSIVKRLASPERIIKFKV